jgi:hypothetical protein
VFFRIPFNLYIDENAFKIRKEQVVRVVGAASSREIKRDYLAKKAEPFLALPFLHAKRKLFFKFSSDGN